MKYPQRHLIKSVDLYTQLLWHLPQLYDKSGSHQSSFCSSKYTLNFAARNLLKSSPYRPLGSFTHSLALSAWHKAIGLKRAESAPALLWGRRLAAYTSFRVNVWPQYWCSWWSTQRSDWAMWNITRRLTSRNLISTPGATPLQSFQLHEHILHVEKPI